MSNGTEERMDTIEEKLDALLGKLGETNGRGRRGRRDEEDEGPRSAREVGRARTANPLEIQGVLLPVKLEVGRHGDSISGYVLLPPVRDERELEDLAYEFEREFRSARVYSARSQYGNGGGGNGGGYRNGGGNGYGYRNGYGGGRGDYGRGNYGRGDYSRRDFGRDRY